MSKKSKKFQIDQRNDFWDIVVTDLKKTCLKFQVQFKLNWEIYW